MRGIALIALLFAVFAPAPAFAEKRVALVIGNSAYRHAPELANPKNDVADMAAKLETLGFEVVQGVDLDLVGMRSTVDDFVKRLEGAELSLYFYAGHGLQVNGINYMAPVDAALGRAESLEFEAVPVDAVLSAMQRGTKTHLVFLDACRNNPLAQNLARSMGTRSVAVGNGLARLGSGVGSLIVFSTQPGNVALDGSGRNSPFTSALLKHLGTPGQDITRDLILVRREVLEATGGKQVPWDNSSLTGEIVLQAGEPAVSQEGQSAKPDGSFEMTFWESVTNSQDKAAFRKYLERFPDGRFAEIATLKIAAIETREAEGAAKDEAPKVVAALAPEPPAKTELEVTHWWTSSGEAAAVAEFAKAFDATGNKWINAGIAGNGGNARTVIVSRLIGGDPMGATQFNHGRQTEELVAAGLFEDLSELATREKWHEIVQPSSLLDDCTYYGKIYCVPVNTHSPQWLWLSHKAFADAGLQVPKNWSEFVAAAPALRKAGKVPLALGRQGWQSNLVFGTLQITVGGIDLWKKVYIYKDAAAAGGPEMAKVFKAAAEARLLSAKSEVQNWTEATNLVVTGQAGGQIMGDWAQAEFQQANLAAGKDYTCLPGLGVFDILSTGGDAFYFPKLKDPSARAAQMQLASLMMSKEVQLAFNLKKGSLPVRGDVDLAIANDCMKKGLKILSEGKIIPTIEQVLSTDAMGRIHGLIDEFWKNPKMSAAAAQKRYAEIIGQAD